MIPSDPEELSTLAGEYVLGLLEPDDAREIERGLPGNEALARAVAFWQTRLAPLSRLAPETAPPPGLWDKISSELGSAPATYRLPVWWNKVEPWRWATAGLAVVAAALLLLVARPPLGSHYIAVLSAPNQHLPGFVVMGGQKQVMARAIEGAAPPQGRAYELWAIYPNVARPQPLGVVPPNGILHVKNFPTEILGGASFAISIEPPEGSPTGQPTGPIVFIGQLRTL